jgi:hypothetical protein
MSKPFTGPADEKFAWPQTEVKVQHEPKTAEGKRKALRVLKRARELARRWEAEDPDVTMRDIIDALLEQERQQ